MGATMDAAARLKYIVAAAIDMQANGGERRTRTQATP
jgi:hypothetical protein